MALREEFENWGNWLFRWRSYFPLAVIAIFFLGMGEYEYPGHSETMAHLWGGMCLLVSFFGLFIRVITVGHTPKGTSGRNTKRQKADALNTTGIYSIVRHPLYLGNFFMGLGIALFPHIWWLSLIYILTFCIYYERIIFVEEEFLRHKFGNKFIDWSNITPAIIPKLKNYKKPQIKFSLKDSIKREYNGFFAVVILIFSLELIGHIVVENKFSFDPVWIFFFIFGFITWLSIMALKKFTKVLNVQGR